MFLWKLENEALPTHSFLKDRLHINIDTICKNCKASQETSIHIFKECKVAVKFWNDIAHWWSLDRNQLEKILLGHWSARKIYVCAKLSQIWNLVISASLWTIWLVMNELVFEKNLLKVYTMIFLLKVRSFKWILAWGGIKKKLLQLWFVNPMRAFLLHCKGKDDPGPI